MARQTKKEKDRAEKERRQLRWEALRLNSGYRKSYDVLCSWVQKKGKKKPYAAKNKTWEKALADPGQFGLKYAILPYSERSLKTAIAKRLRSPFVEDQRLWEDGYDQLVESSHTHIEIPDYIKFPQEFIQTLDLTPKNNAELFEKTYKLHVVGNESFEIHFDIFSNKADVVRKVDKAFELIGELRQLLKAKMPNTKVESIREMLSVYEIRKYKNMSLKSIAQKRKFKQETINAAYMRVKKQFASAQKIVEKDVSMNYPF